MHYALDLVDMLAKAPWVAMVVVVAGSAALATAAPTPANTFAITAESTPAGGWVSDGYGMLHFQFANQGATDQTVVKLSGQWHANGKPMREPWNWDVGQAVKAGETGTFKLQSWMPPNVADASQKETPYVVVTATLKAADGTESTASTAPVKVPIARLPEPLKLVKGKLTGIEVMESRYKTFNHTRQTLAFLDKAYAAMQELTGYTPYDGHVLVYRELPDNPSWAYAGDPIMINTRFVASTLEEWQRGEISFGWIHEMGHCFDFGGWYIWNGAASEFQANFKLGYVLDTLVTSDSDMRIRSWRPLVGGEKPVIDGRQFIDGHTLSAGDKYLADATRTWDTIGTDEIHAFFIRMVRAYGWDPFKRWYRTYQILEDKGYPKPEDAKARIQLTCAILTQTIGVDQQPTFALWRFPVTAEDAKAMTEKYELSKHVPPAPPASAKATR